MSSQLGTAADALPFAIGTAYWFARLKRAMTTGSGRGQGQLAFGLTWLTNDMLACGMPMPDELSRCLVLNTVAAARTLLRRYDAQLKPFGVTVQQFSLLAAIRFHPGEPVASLAQRVFLDRTSLTRNLDLLERKGLARRVSGAVGNVRLCELTRRGDKILDRLLPEWRQAKSELMEGLSDADAETYLRIAKHLSQE